MEGTGGARKVRFATSTKGNRPHPFGTPHTEVCPFGVGTIVQGERKAHMKKRKPTAGERMIASAKEALAYAQGREPHGCQVHIPEEVDVKAIREKIALSQSEFAQMFGLSKRTLDHWEHGRRIPSGAARAFLKVIAREPEAVRRALLS